MADLTVWYDGACPLCRRENGRILSGAAGFAAMWRAIPLLKPFGHLARLPLLNRLFEAAYRAFLRVRPRLQRLASD